MIADSLKLRVDRFSDRKGRHLGCPATPIIPRNTTRGIKMDRTRENNHNWRGGRVTTQHGYILIRIGVGHPLADCRGYAYEHRVVLSEKLGRLLEKGEKTHHIDGDRKNNNPENLKLVTGNAEHYYEHRKTSNLRKPHEPNLIIKCLCGCGRTFPKFDKTGRPRKYVSGHNGRKK